MLKGREKGSSDVTSDVRVVCHNVSGCRHEQVMQPLFLDCPGVCVVKRQARDGVVAVSEETLTLSLGQSADLMPDKWYGQVSVGLFGWSRTGQR